MATCRDCCNYNRTNTHYCRWYGATIADNVIELDDAKEHCAGFNKTTTVK